MLESASDIPFEDIDGELAERYLHSLGSSENTWEFFSKASKAMTRIYGATGLMAAGVFISDPSETKVGISAGILVAGAIGFKAIAEPLTRNRYLEAEFNRIEYERAWDKHLGIDE